jgi:hypothetical protein
MRRPHKGHSSPRYVAMKTAWCKGRKHHWLGYTRTELVHRLRPFSVDSSNWMASIRYGFFHVYVGGGRWSQKYMSARRKALHRDPGFVLAPGVPLPPDLRRALAEVGATPTCFRDERVWGPKGGVPYSRHHVMNLCSLNWVKYVRDLRAAQGTRYFLANNASDPQVVPLFHWINATDKSGLARPEFDARWQ